MIWKVKPEIDVLNKINQNTLASLLGITIIEIGDDYIKATMPVNNNTKQPMGLLHGGASAALSESIGSIAGVLLIEDLSKQSVVGIELNANHLRSVKKGLLTSVTKAVKVGRKIQVWNTEVYDDQDRLICTSRLTTMIIEN